MKNKKMKHVWMVEEVPEPSGGARAFWTRIGIAYENVDGSLSVTLSVPDPPVQHRTRGGAAVGPQSLGDPLADTTAVSRYSVQVAPGVDAAAFAGRLQAAALSKGLPIAATRWQDHPFGDLYRRGMDLLAAFRSFVVVIVIAIAAMSVSMTMMRAVAERTREVGMLRSLGFLRRHVVALFLLEASLLAVASCAVGALCALALIAAGNRAGVTYKAGVLADSIPLAIAVVPGVWLAAVAFLSAVAALATWLPARRAARLAIPDALAHV